MRRILLLALCGVVFSGRAFAGELPAHLGVAGQDATGKVWAFSQQSRPEWYAFENGEWKAVPLTPPEKEARPVSIVGLNDGALAVVWRLPGKGAALTRHLGSEVTEFARGDIPLPKENRDVRPPFVDSQNRLWFTDCAPEIHRVDPDGTTTLIHTLQPEEVFLGSRTGSRSAWKEYNPIQAVEDGKGRIWFWNRGSINRLSLKGVMIVEDGKADLRELPPFKGMAIRVIAKKDARHLWVACFKAGLFTLDIETMAATPVEEPAPGAFAAIHQIFSIDGAWYVVANQPNSLRYYARTAIWQLRDGKWIHRTPAPQESQDWRAGDGITWVKTDHGLLFLARQNNPLFLPPNKPALRLDWRSGFPLRDPHQLFGLPDGKFLAWDGYKKSLHEKLKLPPRPAPSPRVTDIEEVRPWNVDSNGEPWWISRITPETLHHWSRGKVEAFPLPKEALALRESRLRSDGAGRLWLFPQKVDEPIFFFSVKERKWSAFPNAPAAFEACLENPPLFGPEHDAMLVPSYGTDGRQIVFRADNALHHFDGKEWKLITRGMIGVPTVGMPFFDPEDRLCSLILSEVWQHDGARWNNLGPARQSPEPSRPYRPNLPDDRKLEPLASSAIDSLGTYWFTGGGMLYKTRPGLPAVAVFKPGERHPFLNGTGFRSVEVDQEGNAFFEMNDSDRWVIVAAKEKGPKSSITFQKEKGEPARAVLKSTGSHLEWRLDGGPWQPYGGKPIDLKAFSGGRHFLEARAFNAELWPEPPVSSAFTNPLPPEAPRPAPEPAPPMERLIADLQHPDYAKRAMAIATLARHPGAALPALKTARQTADDDRRWWIDAAIQEIER